MEREENVPMEEDDVEATPTDVDLEDDSVEEDMVLDQEGLEGQGPAAGEAGQ